MLVYLLIVASWDRFNLTFSILDADRCTAIEAGSGQDNPFDSEQQVLCTLEFLRDNPQRHRQAVAGDWDLLSCDETHPLHWTPQHSSLDYDLVAALAADHNIHAAIARNIPDQADVVVRSRGRRVEDIVAKRELFPVLHGRFHIS